MTQENIMMTPILLFTSRFRHYYKTRQQWVILQLTTAWILVLPEVHNLDYVLLVLQISTLCYYSLRQECFKNATSIITIHDVYITIHDNTEASLLKRITETISKCESMPMELVFLCYNIFVGSTVTLRILMTSDKMQEFLAVFRSRERGRSHPQSYSFFSKLLRWPRD